MMTVLSESVASGKLSVVRHLQFLISSFQSLTPITYPLTPDYEKHFSLLHQRTQPFIQRYVCLSGLSNFILLLFLEVLYLLPHQQATCCVREIIAHVYIDVREIRHIHQLYHALMKIRK